MLERRAGAGSARVKKNASGCNPAPKGWLLEGTYIVRGCQGCLSTILSTAFIVIPSDLEPLLHSKESGSGVSGYTGTMAEDQQEVGARLLAAVDSLI